MKEKVKKYLENNKKLPFYLRYSEMVESKKGSLVCVLESKDYQTKEYNRKKCYKPIIIEHVSV